MNQFVSHILLVFCAAFIVSGLALADNGPAFDQEKLDYYRNMRRFDYPDPSGQQGSETPPSGQEYTDGTPPQIDQPREQEEGLQRMTDEDVKEGTNPQRRAQPEEEKKDINLDFKLNIPDWVFYILGFTILGLLAFFIIKNYRRSPKDESLESEEPVGKVEKLSDNIHEIDFDTQIDQMVREGAFRQVIRLLYLQTLKQLTDRQLIKWHPDKTNREYVDELKDSSKKHDFRYLTTVFEYVWYGEIGLNREQFNKIREQFKAFDQSIK